jgi:hypothetical protein
MISLGRAVAWESSLTRWLDNNEAQSVTCNGDTLVILTADLLCNQLNWLINAAREARRLEEGANNYILADAATFFPPTQYIILTLEVDILVAVLIPANRTYRSWVTSPNQSGRK